MRKFIKWYEQYENINIVVAALLFSIQVVHLFWLTTNVVIPRIFDISPLITQYLFNIIVAVVDYTEIPALITTSLVYVQSYRKRGHKKDLLYLAFLNIQWLHILWITDEIVIEILGAPKLIGHWNHILAWAAIAIDYLELPVIFETLKRAFKIIVRK